MMNTLKDVQYVPRCPGKNFSRVIGGNAVLQARSLYRLVSATEFDDATLCSAERGGSPALATALDVRVQPNPATDRAQVQWPETGQAETITLVLFDAAGRMAVHREVPAAGRSAVMEVGTQTSGMYFLSVYDGARLLTQEKLVILSR